MKHEKLWTFVTAGTLAFLTARGIQGCLTTAFGLNLEHPAFPVLLCALAAYISAALFSWFGNQLDTGILKKLFGFLLIFTGIRELFYKKKKAS